MKAENFIRSAIAPAISAGVMIANVIWKNMYTDSGIVPASGLIDFSVIEPSMKELKLPMNWFMWLSALVVNATE